MGNISLQVQYLDINAGFLSDILINLQNKLSDIFDCFKNQNLSFMNKLNNKNIEISLVITNDTEIAKLNNEWRGINQPTNVLSLGMFDLASEDLSAFMTIPLGDIVISIDTAEREAIDENINVYEHIIRLFVHGLLHILGFQHELEADAVIMYKLEDVLLRILEVSPQGLVENYWKK